MIKDIIEKSSEFEKIYSKDEFLKEIIYPSVSFDSNNRENVSIYLSKLLSFIINNPEKEIFYLLDKMVELQDELLKQIEILYSDRILLNTELQELIKDSIVPYYKYRFTINKSREISFLPLELRLKIYSDLLKLEIGSFGQLNLLDRISLTLYKANESYLGDIASFLHCYIAASMSESLTGKKADIISNLITHQSNLNAVKAVRDKSLKESGFDSTLLGSEFWYGLTGFGNLNKIHDLDAAKICLDLFTSYFKNSFRISEQVKSVITKYYTSKNESEVQLFLEKIGLDEASVQSFIVLNGNILSDASSNNIEEIQKSIINKNNSIHISLFNPRGLKIKSKLETPDLIAQDDALQYISQVINFRIHYKINYVDWEKEFKAVYIAIAKSEDWDSNIKCLVLGLLSEIYVIAYIRNKESIKDLEKIQMILRGMLKQNSNFKEFYEGWANTVVCEDRDSNPKWAVVNCMDIDTPPYIGITFVRVKISELPTSHFVNHYKQVIIHAGSYKKFIKVMDLSRNEIRIVNKILQGFKEQQIRKINSVE